MIAFAGAQNGARYLIITHDNYYSSMLPLAEWKDRTGMKCRVKRLSEIGPTADAIRNYVLNAYNTWSPRPEYLLLVGAPNFLPFPQVGGVYSDNYYTDMDGDVYNEILSGRLTVHDTIEAKTVVNKILLYQRRPYTADPAWFKKGTLIVNQNFSPEDSIYWSDARNALACMSENGFIQVDTFSNIYDNDAQDVIDAVNNGRSYLMYRGAATNNWYSPFDCNPDITQNSSRLPIVLSVTCGTLGTGSTPAAAERWFLTGTPSIPRGGSGYLATSTQYHAGSKFRSAVAKGFFDGAFRDRRRTFAEACEEGRSRAYAQYPDSGRYEYLGFTTVGDPEMALWTDSPCSLVVAHPSIIPSVSTDIPIDVVRASSGSAVTAAFVCAAGRRDTLTYALDTTDAEGYVFFHLSPHYAPDTVFVTVSGRNLRPYEGRMIVQEMFSPCVVYRRSLVDDSLSGNSDGVINPGEGINLPVWVENWGADPGYGVSGTLRTADPLAIVNDSIRMIGTVEGHDSAFTGSDGFKFSVSPECPDGHGIEFILSCRDQNDSIWISSFHRTVRSADLIFQGDSIAGGNGNAYFEVGETVSVMVRLKNKGSGGADSVRATIRSSSPYSGIIDSSGTYLHIGPDTVAINEADPFVVFNDSLTPGNTVIEYQIAITAGYYTDTIGFSLMVGRQAYFLWNPDPTPASGVKIDSCLRLSGYFGTAGDRLPLNMDPFRTLFVCAGVYPNKHVIIDTGVEARTIRDFILQDSGRVYLEGGDVWWYDPAYRHGFHFDSLFGLNATADGSPDMGPVAGRLGTFTAGMYFDYAGENNWMDHISPWTGSLIFRDENNDYDCGVAYDAGAYRTVGVSFELGLLVDGSEPSSRQTLLDSIMHFFGIAGGFGITERCERSLPPVLELRAYPTPFQKQLRVELEISKPTECEVVVYDLCGRQVRTLLGRVKLPSGQRILQWDGHDDRGRRAANGIYFIQIKAGPGRRGVDVIYLK